MSKFSTTAVHVRWSDPVGSLSRGRMQFRTATPSDRRVGAFVRRAMELKGSGRSACGAEQICFILAEDNWS